MSQRVGENTIRFMDKVARPENKGYWTNSELALKEMFPGNDAGMEWRKKAIDAFENMLPGIERVFNSSNFTHQEKKTVFFKYNINRVDVKTSNNRKKLAEDYNYLLEMINKS